MVGRKRTIERRRHKRYKAVEGAYAAISPHSHKLGQVIDISMGGLSFKYIDTTSDDADFQQTPEEMSVQVGLHSCWVGDMTL